MTDLIQLDSYPVQTTLKLLLQDKTTRKNIIWATDSYASLGEAYTDRSQITESQLLTVNYGMIQPRISKDIFVMRSGSGIRTFSITRRSTNGFRQKM